MNFFMNNELWRWSSLYYERLQQPPYGILIMTELWVSDKAGGGVLKAEKLSFEPSSENLGFMCLTCECQTRSGQTHKPPCYSVHQMSDMCCCPQSDLLHRRSPATGPDGEAVWWWQVLCRYEVDYSSWWVEHVWFVLMLIWKALGLGFPVLSAGFLLYP